jgi:hypothetical protein
MKWLILTHAAVTLFLVGLIWTIQLVHYPLFNQVGSDNYVSYQAGHQWRITTIVLPAMVLELATAGLLLLARPPELPLWAIVLGAVLVGVIWASTLFIQVPQHAVLDRGFNEQAYRALVSTNWIRTAAWSVRGGLALWLVSRLMG